MKKELIVVHQWHSGIGEQIIALHFFLKMSMGVIPLGNF
jgi:hypothetical protein